MEDVRNSQEEEIIDEDEARAKYADALKAWFINSGREETDEKISAVVSDTLRESGIKGLVQGEKVLNGLTSKFTSPELKDPVFKFPEQINSPVSSEKKPESR